MGLRESLKRFSPTPRCPSCSRDQQKQRSLKPTDVTSSTPDHYQYTALDVSQQQIRIFSIEGIASGIYRGGDQSLAISVPDTIYGSLKHVPLYEFPAFVALSYAWGEPTKEASLMVDGKKLPITRSLHEALIHLRGAQILNVWVDAICINQENRDEKASQIRRMSTIYRAADKVIAWIGTHDEQSRPVFDFIKQFRATKGFSISEETVNHLNRSLVALSERPYWTRVWILQEFAIANQLYLMCGDNIEDVGFIRGLLSRFWLHVKVVEPRELTPFQYMWQVRQLHKTGASMGLLEMLMNTTSHLSRREVHRIFQATELIDHIYGILGLVNDGDLFVLEPDYHVKQVNDHFIRMTKFFIRTTKQLDICFLEHGEKPVDFGRSAKIDRESYVPDKLPVWCPDYLNLIDSAQNTELINSFESKQARPADLLGPRHRYSRESHFWNATAGSRVTNSSHTYQDDGSIVLRGKYVGTVISPSAWENSFSAASSLEGEEIDTDPSCWLSALLFCYASGPGSESQLSEIMAALSFVLSDVSCGDIKCCDEGRSELKKKLMYGGAPDDLVPLITKRLMEGSDGLVAIDVKPSEDIHDMAESIVNSIKWNHTQFRRKVAAYTGNENDKLIRSVVAEYGSYGWVPLSACADDEIWLLEGCSVPIILRRATQPQAHGIGTFIKIGTAFINGAMRGAMWSQDHLTSVTITKPGNPFHVQH